MKKEEQYQVLRPDELPSSADIHGSVGSSSVCIAYTFFSTNNIEIADELKKITRTLKPNISSYEEVTPWDNFAD